jgi:hypothetical protein
VSALLSLPAPRSARGVAWSAFVSGSLRALRLRPGRSGAAFVLVCGFASAARAGLFAARWASRLGRSVVVRRCGLLWAVSVPVAPPPAVALGRLRWAPGLRGFALALAGSGL